MIIYDKALSISFNIKTQIADSKLLIDKQALNLLSAICVFILNDILNALSYIITYSHKSYFTAEMIMTACGILFKNPIKEILIKQLDETDREYKQIKKDNILKAQERKKEKEQENNKQKIEDKKSDIKEITKTKEQEKKNIPDKQKKDTTKPEQPKKNIKLNNHSKVIKK